jgi:hypothetical protein
MRKLAQELISAAKEMMVRATITVPRGENIEHRVYNAIHHEIQGYLDRIRRNEGMETLLARVDDDEAMRMQVGFSDHEAGEAITRELVKLTSKVCARNGIETIKVAYEGSEEDTKDASDIVELAKLLTAGTAWRTIRGEGWTEKEALADAMKDDQDEYGHGEGYGGGFGSMREIEKTKIVRKPKRAKRVKVEKSTVRKGPVKKQFVLSKKWGWSSDRQQPIDNDRRLSKGYDTQGEALKMARELALEYGVAISIDLKAFCVGDTHLAEVMPMGGQKGIWEFKIAFRE